MNELHGRRVLLGITGGIAAYKSADLARRLVEAGAEVQVVMSAGAQQFITALTLQAVSGRAVRTSLWDQAAELGMGHIELARWADLVLIAPASADVLARLAQGRADDLLTTLCLASEAPLMVAPAMNQVMWAHPATRENMRILAERDVGVIGPETGELAEREAGPGRMTEPLTIRDRVAAHFATGGPLSGHRVLVTAGPTRESLDPLRFLTNRSSGRMGYALAAACAAAGANVTLISGPSGLPVPGGVECTAIETAEEMFEAVMTRAGEADIVVAAAAVADYRPVERAADKIKKSDGDLSLALTRTRDTLAEVAAGYPGLYTVGFAAETESMEAHARAKRERKGVDMVAGNEVGPERAFGQAENALYVCWANGEARLGPAAKPELARDLVKLIAEQVPRDV